MSIYWSNFVDIEDIGPTEHHSGIQHYQYAIGKSIPSDNI